MQDEAATLATHLAAAVPRMLAPPTIGLARIRGAKTIAFSGMPAADLNMLFVGEAADAPRFLEEGMALARERGLPILVLLFEPVATALQPMVSAAGLAHAGQVPLMQLAEPALPDARAGCDIERVGTGASIAVAARLQAEAFGLPCDAMERLLAASLATADAPEVFLGLREGVPMSTVTATRHDDTIGIWSMATPPAFQRKGVGQALLTHLIADFRAAGVRRFFLIASAAGKPLYERIGFRTQGWCEAWVSERLANEDESNPA
ncbi:MAG TPA: GNAT family N-acetyltransferase [Xanthomonadaceae bacterium]|jgi:ribosomal protein S18 acetylase RimI-like enzyme